MTTLDNYFFIVIIVTMTTNSKYFMNSNLNFNSIIIINLIRFSLILLSVCVFTRLIVIIINYIKICYYLYFLNSKIMINFIINFMIINESFLSQITFFD